MQGLLGAGSAGADICSGEGRGRATTVPPGTVLSAAGANVTLTCPRALQSNGSVWWQPEGRVPGWASGRRELRDTSLVLPAVRPEDSGRYGCRAGGRLLHTVHLLVDEPPEPPRVSCSRRSHQKDILCEWQPRARPSPSTRAVLWVKRAPGANATEQRCRFFPRAHRFVCRIPMPPVDDDKLLHVSVCVSNGAGSAASADRLFSANSVLKPDPPVNLTVDPVEAAPQQLRLSWTYPPSWDASFYQLRFQVRYRAEPSGAYAQVDGLKDTSLVIRDALRGARHWVQVRAREEFDLGEWSEWSREAVGSPWADPREQEAITAWDEGLYGAGGSLLPELLGSADAEDVNTPEPAPDGPSAVSLYTLLAAGGSLLLGAVLFTGIVLRYRRRWRKEPRGRGKPGTEALPAEPPPSPSSPLSDVPLLLPLASPGPYDVANMDYFFTPRAW
ncbi:interleukin-6 receptor subunit alpha precursor [Alligator mississippiensis]|uniref:Interleukin-6 receptor subunit alpha n=1 Tax=Alligator mississippiensis TaxID=8496 RepID=A0A151PG85_ALLMI|nr:interleukin-6 receptor subunit alpha precursor [Alligator mississippiensis]